MGAKGSGRHAYTDLSPKETLILQEIAKGKSMKQVAATLHYTTNGCGSMVADVYRKLHIPQRNTYALAIYAYRRFVLNESDAARGLTETEKVL